MTALNLPNQAGVCGGTANAERSIASIARATEWWQHKLAVALGTAYLTAGLYEVAAASLWWRLLVLLTAFVPGAFYVCVLNDVTDRDDDLRCGKSNRMAARSRMFTAAALAIGPALGVLVGFFLMTGPLTRWFYAADWLAFTLYSVPPFRFKGRGLSGVITDACGGQMLPGLWVAAYVAESSGQVLDVRLGVCLALWGFAVGLRGILHHQIEDRDQDQAAGVRTLLVRGNVASTQKLVKWVVFPVEVVALAGLLILFRAPLPWLLLGVHLLLQWMRVRFFGINVILVRPRPNERVALAEYYQLLLPAAILLTMASGDRWALLFLAAHLCLFPDVTRRFLKNVGHLVRWRCVHPVGHALGHYAHQVRWQWIPRLGRKLRLQKIPRMMKAATIYSAAPALRNPALFFSEAWHDLRACHGIAWRLFVRNVRVQYRRSFLGYGWLLLPPIATTLTWVFLSRARIVAIGATTLPFPLYVLTGTMLWQAFVEALNCPVTQLRGAREMVTKVRVPHEAFVLAGLGSIVFNLSVRLVVLAVAMLLWRWPIPWSALAAPIPIAALLTLAGALGLLLAPAGLLYQDVQRSVEVMCGFAFFVTPIVYPAPRTWPASLLNSLNPMAPLLETARNWLALGLVTAPGFFAVTGASLALLGVSWIFYRLAVPHLVSRL